MTRLSLVILCALLLACGPKPGVKDVVREHYLFRQFTKAEMALVESTSWRPTDYDGFSYGHIGSNEDALKELTGDCYRYFQILHVQPDAWRWAPYSLWFAGLTHWITAWDAFLVAAPGDTARFRYYGGRDYIFNWGALNEAEVDTLVALTLYCAKDCDVFLDQVWHSGMAWMWPDSLSYPVDAERWDRMVTRYVKALRSVREVIVLGAWDWPGPLFLENVGSTPLGSWDDALTLWYADPRNVLSVPATDSVAVVKLLDIWRPRGGRIAFTKGTWPYHIAKGK